MNDKEPLKITLEDLGLGEPHEPPPPADPAGPRVVMPEKTHGKVREGAEQVGQRVAGAVKDSTSKVTQKIADTTAEAASRSADAVRDKVSEAIQQQTKATADAVEARLREIDWKAEAQKGAEGGLHWLSKRLEELAERLRSEEKK